ncbi:Hypothetical Protein FCC1311_050812 [Hondaea fermentalgiana]|uniref:Uncharacterized protein n=1 Tax=Hondaea fermentalgiana TaxID=2315210 RepID=A0A2R5GD04_9STRA|nr:Hypothetical Protein FCC1311_050812 [Hondaea fermentalgiana]|eukprot:GBG28860.1 Hypothetical Protein FCC1311_050812 [Hondaea fermentalgiana]
MASKADLAPWAATRKAAVWRTLTSVPQKTLNITPEAKAKRGSPLPEDADAKRVTLVASECVRLQALRIPFPDVPGAGGLQMLEALASTLGKGMPTSEVTKKMSTAAVAAAAASQDGAAAEGNKAKGNRMHYMFDGLEELMLVEKTVERNDGGSRNRLRHARFTSKAYLSDFKEESSAIKASEKLRGLARRVIRLLAAACSDLRVGHLAYGDVIFLLGIKSRTLWTFLEQEWKAGRSYVETRFASIRLMSSQDRTTHQDFFARVARRAKRNKAVTGVRRILVLHKTPLIAKAPGGGVGAGPVPSSSSSSSSKDDDDGEPSQEEEKDEGTRIAQRTLGMSQAGAVHGVSVTQQIFESAVAAGESGISITEMVDLMGMEFRSLARSLHRVVGGPSKKNRPSKKNGPSKKKPRSLPLKMAQSRALGKYNAVALISAGESELEKYGKSLLARERDSRVEKLKAAGYLRDVESIQRTDRQAFRMRVIFNAINAMGAVSMRRLMYEIHEQEDGMFDGVCDIESRPLRKSFKTEDVPLAVLNITNFPEGGDFDKDLLMGLLQASKLEHGDATRVLNYFFDVRLMVRARLLHGELLKYCRNKYGAKAPVEAPIDMRAAFEAMPVVLYLRIVKRPIASAGHGPTWTAETCEKAVEAALRGVTIKEAGRPELLECWPAGALRVLRELSLVRKEEAGREDQSSTWSLSMSGALKKNEYDFQSNSDVDAYWWSLRRHAAKTTSEDEMWHAVNWALFASMAVYRPPGASSKSTKASGKRKRAMGQRKGGRKKSRAGANSVALRPIGSAGLLEGPVGAAHKRRRERVEPWPPDLTRTAFEAYISSLDMGDVTRTVLKEEPSATSTALAQKKLRAALEGTPERVDVYKIASANIPSNDQHGRVWALRNLVVLHLVQLARQDHTRASAAPFEALCAPLQNVSRDLLTTVLEEFMACGFLHGLPANPTPKWPQYFASAINREAFRKLLKRVGADMQRPRRIQPSAFEFERSPRAEVAAGKSTREILDGDVKGVDLMRILPMLALGEAQLALDYKDAGTASTELPPLVESERSRRAPRVPVSELRNTEEAFAVALEHRRNPPSNGQDQGEGEGKDQPLGLARDEAANERPTEQKTLLQMIAQAGEDGVTNDQVGSFAQDLPALLRRGEVVRVPAFHQDRFVHRSHMGLWMFGHGNAAAVHHPWMSLEGCVDDYFKRSLARALVVHVLDYPGTSRKALFAAFYPILDLVHLNILLDPLLRGPDALLEVHIEQGLEFFSPSLRALDRRFLQPPA